MSPRKMSKKPKTTNKVPQDNLTPQQVAQKQVYLLKNLHNMTLNEFDYSKMLNKDISFRSFVILALILSPMIFYVRNSISDVIYINLLIISANFIVSILYFGEKRKQYYQKFKRLVNEAREL